MRKREMIKKVVLTVVLGIFLVQPVFAQVFLPEPPATFGLPIPNYGVPTSQAIHGPWNEASIMNGIIAAILANNPNVSMNASFNVNTITGNSGILDPYGPLQNGFYLNSLDFVTLLGPKTTLFAHLRNQDDFNRAALLNIQDGHLKETFKYTELIDRKVSEDEPLNSTGIDGTSWFGFPDVPKAPQLASVDTLNFVNGFNPNQYFYPIIDNFLVNDLQYTYNNGLSFFANDWLRSQTGQQYLDLSTTSNFNEINNGRDNNLAALTEGAAYTSPGNDQFYFGTTARSWNDQTQLNQQVVSLTAAGGNLEPTGNLIYNDTRWSINQAGLQIPISDKISFHGSWKRWDKISDGVFGTGGLSTNFNGSLDASIMAFADATDMPTGLQPGFDVNQYRGGLTFNLGPSNAAFFDMGHWEEIPNTGVLGQTLQNRDNADLFFRHIFGNQALSLYGAWEQNNLSRTVDYQFFDIETAFDPFVNTTFGLGTEGSATFKEASTPFGFPVIIFNPAPGSGLSSFVQPAATIPCIPFPGGTLDNCGTNSITYPVDGFENVTAAELTQLGVPNCYTSHVAGCMFPGEYPVSAPTGRQSVTFNTELAQAELNGPLTRNLNYSFKIQKTFAQGSLFRTDPQNQWIGRLHLDWTPTSRLELGAGYRLLDNQSDNSYWIYPFHYQSNTVDFTANYAVAKKISLYASYWNYIQKINMSDPVLLTGTENFVYPPDFSATGPVPAFGNLLSSFLFSQVVENYACAPGAVAGPNTIPACTAGAENAVNDAFSDQDQEIMAGVNFNVSKVWQISANYQHSEPRSFQNVYLGNPLFSPGSDTSGPNIPDGFIAAEPVLDIMQAVNGRENIWGLNFTHEFTDKSSLGLGVDYMVFNNLVPRIVGGSLPIGCTSPIPPYGCGAPFPNYGTNVFEYGQSLDDGSIFSTAITYTKTF
jgi:hypothetical protein